MWACVRAKGELDVWHQRFLACVAVDLCVICVQTVCAREALSAKIQSSVTIAKFDAQTVLSTVNRTLQESGPICALYTTKLLAILFGGRISIISQSQASYALTSVHLVAAKTQASNTWNNWSGFTFVYIWKRARIVCGIFCWSCWSWRRVFVWAPVRGVCGLYSHRYNFAAHSKDFN